MTGNERNPLTMSVAILSAWSGLIFILSVLIGVDWFRLGDFSFRTAMAYHGILIPAWMMLVLAYSQHIKLSVNIRISLGIGAIAGAILTGIGSTLIHGQGFSVGTGIQIAGMVIAEITALVIIIKSFWYHFKISEEGIDPMVWWTVTIALIALSLATPLGHLAGAVKDFGEKFPLFKIHLSFLQMDPKDVLDGYIGSHSHQILAAFLASAFALPLMRKSSGRPLFISITEKIGLLVMLIATAAQTALYQYCAWFGWEPPDLFAIEPNGLPLDDFCLIILGVGMLLLIPGLTAKDKSIFTSTSKDCMPSIKKLIVILLIAYMISVVALGMYIEFHEQYFGHGEGSAVGVPNDLAYIRAHLLFGFTIIPILLGVLLNGNLLNFKKQKGLLAGFIILIVITGTAGIFLWTFDLNPLLIKIAFAFTAIFLLVFALLLAKADKTFSEDNNI